MAVGVLSLDEDGGALQTGFVAVQIVQGLAGKAVALGPAGVHPKEHLGPVLGFGAAGAGMEGEDGVGVVVLSGKEGGQLGLFNAGLQLGKALLHLGHQALVLHLVAQLAQGHQILPLGLAFFLSLDLVPQVLYPLLYLLGLLQVVPKAVGGALRLQHLGLPAGGLQAQGLLQLVQLRPQIVELYLIFIKL